MLRDVIKNLYDGQVIPFKRSIPKDSKRGRAEKVLSAKADALRQILSPDERKLFDEYISEHYLLDALIDEDGFVEGFRLAVQLILAAVETDSPKE